MSAPYSADQGTPRHLTLDAIERELARQDAELAQAAAALAAMGNVVLSVPRESLEAIDRACLVRPSTLTPAAIRG